MRNTVSQVTVGIAVESTTDWVPADASTAPDGNEVDTCAVGILLFSLKQSSVLNGRLQNNIYSMALDTIWNLLAEGNVCSGSATLVHCYEITGLAVQISKNRMPRNNRSY